jgi:hypothetical protein
MLHDSKFFFSPSQFLPERFLEDERSQDGLWVARPLSPVEDPIQIAFGFGRRSVICPFLSGFVETHCPVGSALDCISRTTRCFSPSPACSPCCSSVCRAMLKGALSSRTFSSTASSRRWSYVCAQHRADDFIGIRGRSSVRYERSLRTPKISFRHKLDRWRVRSRIS